MDALPKDLHSSYVAEVAEYEQMIKGKSNLKCDRCGDESDDFKFCCTCCMCLCNWCSKDHTKSLATRKHELIDVGKSQSEKSLYNSIPHKTISCPVHSDEVLKFYCKTCSLLICCDCMALSHSGHSYDRIEAVAESEKTNLLSTMKKAESSVCKLDKAVTDGEKVIRNVQAKQKSMDDEINQCFQDLQKVLTIRKDILLAKSSEIGLGKVTALKLQGEQMKRLSGEITRVCERIKEASGSYVPVEMLSAKGPMSDKLSSLLEQFDTISLDPCKNERATTYIDSSAITSGIEKLGTVTAGGSCASNSTIALYMPQACAIKGREKKFVVTARDVEGKPFYLGGEVVEAKMQLIGKEVATDTVVGKVQDNQNGTYSVSLTPQTIGEHQLSVTIGNEPIKSSPFVVSVQEPRNYNSLSIVQKYYSTSSQPWDVALGDNNEVFVAGYGSNCIEVFNQNGDLLRTIGGKGSGDLQFSAPIGIAIRGDIIYVADSSNYRVQKLTTSGEHIATFGSKGSGEGQLNQPYGICTDPEGNIYVSECNANHRISVFSADGTFKHFITGNMRNPWGMAFDLEGNLHVASYSTNTIMVFSSDGNYVKQYGSINQPAGITIDPEGYILVACHSTSAGVKIFSPQLSEVPTSIPIRQVLGVALDTSGFVYTCGGNQVLKY